MYAIRSYYGLAKFDGLDWTTYYWNNSGLPGDYVRALAIDDGDIWVGTGGGGLAKFNGTTWRIFEASHTALPDDQISSLAVDGT